MRRLSLLILLTFITACSNSNGNDTGEVTCATCGRPPIKNAKPGLGKAVIIGDSLAAGVGATDWNVKPAGCLFNAFKQPTVDNAKPGRTSIETLMSVQASLDEKPKVVFISSGGNDAILDKQNPGSYEMRKTMEEMHTLFQRALDSGALVVYLGLNPPFAGGERLKALVTMARQMGVIVVDGMEGFWGNSEFMSDDIHPNDKGYKILCARTLIALQSHYP